MGKKEVGEYHRRINLVFKTIFSRFRHASHPRRPGRRPGHRRHGRADLRHLHLHPGGSRPAQGLRIFAQRQPDAHRPGDVPRRPGRRRTRPGLRLRTGGDDGGACRMLKPGDEVVAAADLYGGTYRLLERVFKPWGLTARYTDDSSAGGFRQAHHAGDEARLDRDADQSAAANPRHRRHRRSWRTRPGRCWRSITRSPRRICSSRSRSAPISSVHSTTKYLGGHSDVVGGAVIGRKDLLQPIAFYQNAAGGVPGPFDAYLTLRGLKTLAVRMDRHCANARQLADWLSEAAAGRARLLSRLAVASGPRRSPSGRCATSAA